MGKNGSKFVQYVRKRERKKKLLHKRFELFACVKFVAMKSRCFSGVSATMTTAKRACVLSDSVNV